MSITVSTHHNIRITNSRQGTLKKGLEPDQGAKGPGDDVRAVGSDIQAGELVLASGSVIGPAEIGLLATVGAQAVQVSGPAEDAGPACGLPDAAPVLMSPEVTVCCGVWSTIIFQAGAMEPQGASGADVFCQSLPVQAAGLQAAAQISTSSVQCDAARGQVHRRPRVAVLSTGDELVEPSVQHLGPGQIRDANRHMLTAAVRSAGCEVVDLGIARDDIAQARTPPLHGQPSCDALLLSAKCSSRAQRQALVLVCSIHCSKILVLFRWTGNSRRLSRKGWTSCSHQVR